MKRYAAFDLCELALDAEGRVQWIRREPSAEVAEKMVTEAAAAAAAVAQLRIGLGVAERRWHRTHSTDDAVEVHAVRRNLRLAEMAAQETLVVATSFAVAADRGVRNEMPDKERRS